MELWKAFVDFIEKAKFLKLKAIQYLYHRQILLMYIFLTFYQHLVQRFKQKLCLFWLKHIILYENTLGIQSRKYHIKDNLHFFWFVLENHCLELLTRFLDLGSLDQSNQGVVGAKSKVNNSHSLVNIHCFDVLSSFPQKEAILGLCWSLLAFLEDFLKVVFEQFLDRSSAWFVFFSDVYFPFWILNFKIF